MKNTKICLNAMVGNEAATIQRMLDSVVKHIDYYVVQCNGNDETREIIDNFFQSMVFPASLTLLSGTIQDGIVTTPYKKP